jgi:cobalt transporter subunit CbtA
VEAKSQMLGKIILSTLVAGLLAGLVMAWLQYFRLEPLIQAAETFEAGGDPTLRNLFTRLVPPLLSGAGFSILMLGVSFLTKIPITKQNGLIWGICGFIAVSLAPSIGLPPQLPGMPTIDLYTRQIWWGSTVLLTCAATYLWVKAKNYGWQIAAIVVALAPQFFAPINSAKTESNLPANLASNFVSSSLGANLIMWLAIGYFVSLALDKYQKEIGSL